MPTMVRLDHAQRKEFTLLVDRIGWSWPRTADKFGLKFGALIAVRRGERDFDLDNFDYLRRVARAVEAVPAPGTPDVSVENTLANLFLSAADKPEGPRTALEDAIDNIATVLGCEKTVAELIQGRMRPSGGMA